MTYESFITSINQNAVPQDLHPLLKALWYDKKGDWEAAHDVAQSKEGTLDFDRLHAYLHRKEGDEWNAGYWYRRCGEVLRKIPLEVEWKELVLDFIAKY